MIYTKKGDGGQTSKFDNTSVDKDSLLIEVLGSLDEVGSFLGICKNKASSFNEKILGLSLIDILDNIQNNLFKIQSNITGKEIQDLKLNTKEIELIIDLLEKELKPINQFLKADGNELSLSLNYARTLVRKLERKVVALTKKETLVNKKEIFTYLNRLSDLFFMLFRFVNSNSDYEEKFFNK
ncbi:MAG: cob(I)yrinic acid a,c-diamide adenosyltransferase [Patescibacteria group bacterium]|nr:cob(I)yrinic acid a,c-diamide adenosyltransferase [Patescibacteria group bacterium]